MALVEFLAAKPMPVPRPITSPPVEAHAGDGFVTASFAAGALLLEDEQGAQVRPSWGELEENAADRRRALAPGTYTLVGYRVLATDDDGLPWHVSATGRNLAQVEVRRGKTTEVKVDEAIRISSRIHRDQLQVRIRGHEGAGLSIYRQGRRIPVGFRSSAAGREPVTGKIEYG